ncbi:MAG: class I SAM-dependent methyltransferase [Actinomycetota bacterium]
MLTVGDLRPAFTRPSYLSDQPWWHGHIPFAFFLVATARPDTLVELGTHKGDSYMAFCQAVGRFGLNARCCAVDHWQGDQTTGEYDESVYDALRAVHDPAYSDFSRLLKSTFAAALSEFPDGSVDILHIDGTHTYEAVRADFHSWLPKLSRRGVVLLHDVAAYLEGFGVWRLWDELAAEYPSFLLPHSAGLGVLAVGDKAPEPVRSLCSASEDDQDAARWTFAVLGRALLVERDPRRAWLQVRRLADLPPPGDVGLRTRGVLQRCPRW